MMSLVEVKAGNILIESWKNYREEIVSNMTEKNSIDEKLAVGKMLATYDIAAAMFGPGWAKKNLE